MVRIGLVGVGFMGWIHWLAYRAVDGIEVRAICTRDAKKRAGDWRGIKGNFGPPGEQVDLTGVRTYGNYAEMLADRELDVIDICLPPYLHSDTTTQALAAGKHVFCEKPLALTPEACDSLCTAARQSGKLLLVGQVLPFFPEYAYACQAIQRGDYGRLLGGSFKRVISDPQWLPDFYDLQRVGGPLVDLHVHDAHFIRLLFGMPQRVATQGRLRGDVVEHCHSLFYFQDPALCVTATCGVIRQQGRSFTHGFEIHCERATLQYEFAVTGDSAQLLMPLTVFDEQGGAVRPALGEGDPLAAFRAEIEEVRRAVVTGQPSPILSGALARDAILLCHRQAKSAAWRVPVDV